MDPESKNNSPVAMDSLAALNIVPFLGLMNLVEVRYLHMPEVYRTMLAILCDYDPVSRDNVIKTRRYLSVLLAREPDLAQCLLNFIDAPEEPMNSSAHDNNSDESNVCHNATTQGLLNQSTDKKPADNIHDNDRAVGAPGVQCEQMGNYQISEMKDVQTSDSNKCSLNTETLATPNRHTDIPRNVFNAKAPKQNLINSQPSIKFPLCDQQKNLSSNHDNMSKNVPLVNIYHNDIFISDKSSDSVSKTTQQLSAPFFLPRFLTSQLNATDQAEALVADKCRDQATFTPTPISVSGQRQAEANSAVFTTQITAPQNFNNRGDRQCRAAQTQTLTTHDSTSTNDALVPVKLSKATHAISQSPSDPLTTLATSASQPGTITPSICLSKLLGQPSVAYLPAGHFIDNRNSIIGNSACKSTAEESLPYNSPILNVKMNSAAAKLHLLSTQAGNEKSGSLQDGYGQAVGNATTSFGPLSTPFPSSQKDSRIKTTVKLSSKPGCRKMITLSKIVPVLKPDTVQDQSDTKINAISYDKQIQVGQRQICKKSKTTIGKKEEACQIYSQTTNCTNSQEELPEQQPAKDLSEEQQKNSSVLQPTKQKASENNTEIKRLLQNRRENQVFSASHQKCQVTKKTRATKQKHQNNDTFPEKDPKSEKSPVSTQNQATEEMLDNLPENRKKRQLEWGQEGKSWVPKYQTFSSKKSKQDNGSVTSIKEVQRQKVQVVGVSGTRSSSSLSAFPYIQQMILPDGQVSTIAHNSHTAPALFQQSEQQKDSSTTAGSCYTVRERKSASSKPTTQIVLPRKQLKLSVSIQTSTKKTNTASSKKEVQTISHPINQPCLKNNSILTDTAQMSSNTATKEKDVACNVSAGKTTPANASNLLHDSQDSGNSLGKRKRSSPLCRRNATAKTMKLRF